MKNLKISFAQVWGLICVSHYKGEETSQFLIDRSLMRPRNLLKLVGYCKGFVVNLDHEKIDSEDITKGLQSYSNDLVIIHDKTNLFGFHRDESTTLHNPRRLLSALVC